MERRLCAILAADVVGYSRLMEQDEAGTFERLRAHRKDVFEPEIEKHRGRVFKLMGDGLLAEFGSIMDAVECAVALQGRMAEQNASLVAARRIDVRIGINLGEVIVDGEDRYGDGVNIAARLQQLAEPGGICVSGKVAKEVERKLAVRFDPMGEQRIKNISEPIPVYRVALDPHVAGSRPVWLRAPWRRRLGWRLAAGLIVLLVAVAGGAAWYFTRTADAPSGPSSIAVLPFANMSGDPADNYLGEGIAEDIITVLSSFPRIQVISRTSSFVYDKPVKVQQVAEDLGVRYVLEGSVRKVEDSVRVTAQLIDATSGAHVWADRYDEAGASIIAIQEEVAYKIYNTLAGLTGQITKSEEEGAWRKSAPSLDEYDYYLRGHALFFRFTKEDVAQARQIWREGLSKFPQSSLLRLKIAFAHEVDLYWGWSDDPATALEEGWEMSRAADADQDKSRLETWLGHWAMAIYCQWHEGDFERSVAEAKAAIQMVPYDARSRADLATFMANAGKTEEAIAWASEAIRREPDAPEWYVAALAFAYYQANRPEEALVEYGKVSRPWGPNLAAVYARLGRIEKARSVIADFLKAVPGYTVKHEALYPAGRQPQLIEPLQSAYLKDLRQAGLPDE